METQVVDGREFNARTDLVAKILAFFKERGYETGERLPSERALAERFSVGRNALREALSTLCALRVIESRRNSGIYLRRISTDPSFETIVLLTEMGVDPSMKEIQDTLEIRWGLELRSAQLACERHTECDLDILAGIILATNEIVADNGNIALQDSAFHLALARSTRNEMLVRLLNSLYRISDGRRFALFADVSRGAVSAMQHQRIFDAVKNRDAAAATILMEHHFSSAVASWAAILGGDVAQEET